MGMSHKKQIAKLNKRINELEKLLVRALDKEVWYWQGDGHDVPETIICPVIMSAETLREILLQREAAPWTKKP
jgi:hypothetical protein